MLDEVVHISDSVYILGKGLNQTILSIVGK